MNKKVLILISMSLCALVSCSKSPETKILELANSAELGTVEYTVKKIVKANDSDWFTVGDRKMIFSVTAYLKAGIDLGNLTPDKVLVNKQTNSVKLILPHATLLSFNMPVEEAVVEYQQVGSMRADFTAEDRNNLLTQGEQCIRNDTTIMEGINRDAEENASLFFKTAISSIGFNDVNVIFE